MPYTGTVAYHWENLSAGVAYVHAWARDAAGVVSVMPSETIANLLPANAGVDAGSSVVYRYTLNKGERLRVALDRQQGDADLVVWPPDDEVLPTQWVSNRSDGSDSISVVAAESGSYQVEVRGTTAARYALRVTVEPNAEAGAPAVGGIDAALRVLLTTPAVPLDDTPLLSPVAPALRFVVYLPLAQR